MCINLIMIINFTSNLMCLVVLWRTIWQNAYSLNVIAPMIFILSPSQLVNSFSVSSLPCGTKDLVILVNYFSIIYFLAIPFLVINIIRFYFVMHVNLANMCGCRLSCLKLMIYFQFKISILMCGHLCYKVIVE